MEGKGKRLAAGVVVAGIACAVYAWSVIGAFAHGSARSSAFAAAYQYSSDHVTGGGQILGGSVNFGFDVKTSPSGILGSCNVQERRATSVSCLSITALAVTGTHGTFTGTATVNGVKTTFRIDVDDLGEPSRDRFAITTGTGFSRSGQLTAGNIQLHAP